MVMNTLKLSATQYNRLWSHLLPTSTMVEQAAFLFCSTESSGDKVIFEVLDQIFLHESDFVAQHTDYLELNDATRIRLIKRAHAMTASLAEFHSHPGPWPAAFSLSDRIGLKETVVHMRWRLKKRPYLAIVVAPSGFDALVWSCDAKNPKPLTGIDVDGDAHDTDKRIAGRVERMIEHRFDRNERLFGRDGQARLRRTQVVVMGAGGLGSHVIAQIALLGVGGITPVDRQEISLSNRNRYIGVWHTDPIPGSPKVEIAKRHIHLIDQEIPVNTIQDDILSEVALKAIKEADYVFGCVDDDGVRFFMNEACLAYAKPLIDLASDVPEAGVFGGRVVIVSGGHGCLYCLDELDPKDLRRFLSSAKYNENEDAVYGIHGRALSETGPSVVSVNGVVASLGVTAFMALATGMELPYTFQTYRGDHGTVTRKTTTGNDDCYYCCTVRGLGDRAKLDRYFR